jgi:hypothetical protein
VKHDSPEKARQRATQEELRKVLDLIKRVEAPKPPRIVASVGFAKALPKL